jgi:hypothetical protein
MNKKSVLALLLVLISINILLGMNPEDSAFKLENSPLILTPFFPLSPQNQTDVCEIYFQTGAPLSYKSVDYTGNDEATTQNINLEAFTNLSLIRARLLISPDQTYGLQTELGAIIAQPSMTYEQLQSIAKKIKDQVKVIIYDKENSRRYDIFETTHLSKPIQKQIAHANKTLLELSGALAEAQLIINQLSSQRKEDVESRKNIPEKSEVLLASERSRVEQKEIIIDLEQKNKHLMDAQTKLTDRVSILSEQLHCNGQVPIEENKNNQEFAATPTQTKPPEKTARYSLLARLSFVGISVASIFFIVRFFALNSDKIHNFFYKLYCSSNPIPKITPRVP